MKFLLLLTIVMILFFITIYRFSEGDWPRFRRWGWRFWTKDIKKEESPNQRREPEPRREVVRNTNYDPRPKEFILNIENYIPKSDITDMVEKIYVVGDMGGMICFHLKDSINNIFKPSVADRIISNQRRLCGQRVGGLRGDLFPYFQEYRYDYHGRIDRSHVDMMDYGKIFGDNIIFYTLDIPPGMNYDGNVGRRVDEKIRNFYQQLSTGVEEREVWDREQIIIQERKAVIEDNFDYIRDCLHDAADLMCVDGYNIKLVGGTVQMSMTISSLAQPKIASGVKSDTTQFVLNNDVLEVFSALKTSLRRINTLRDNIIMTTSVFGDTMNITIE